ncbi:ribbon-helix-helix domain-containing protein [Biomaibacter acetigenes]
MLKSQRKANNVLVHKRTVNLNKTQFNRISELSKTYGIARSEIIRKSIEEFLKKDFLHREG